MKNCIIYTRVSSEEYDFGLHAQEEILRKYASENNLIVGKVIRDVGSATKSNRKGLIDLASLIQTGEYQGILCTGLDRISRNYQIFCDFQKKAKTKNVKLITPIRKVRLNPAKMLLDSTLSNLAQYDKSLRSERIKRGIKKAKLHKEASI